MTVPIYKLAAITVMILEINRCSECLALDLAAPTEQSHLNGMLLPDDPFIKLSGPQQSDLIQKLAAVLDERPSKVPPAHAAESVPLFNGKDLGAWSPPTGTWQVCRAVTLDPGHPEMFLITPGEGVLVNNPKGPTVNLISSAEFGDLQLHIEFCISKHSNSGVYLMGRYEIQIYDSYGVDKDEYAGIECGGVYPRWINDKGVNGHSPDVNASKPAGEWQSFDITFRAPRFDSTGKKTTNARFVKVLHNGKLIHENIDLTGPTRAAHWEDEKPAGPVMLQGDHGPVAYRNLRATRLPKLE